MKKRKIPQNIPTLDLHGYRTEEVFTAIDRFIRQAQGRDHEYIRIITGKGLGKVRAKTTFSSRHSASYLATVGFEEFITKTPEEYIATSIELADDENRLIALRQNLRQLMLQSPLCNIEKFGPEFLSALKKIC